MATASQTQSLDAGPTRGGAGGGQSSWAAKLRAPGFYRAGWMMVLGVAFAFALTWLIRMSYGHATYRHYIDGEAVLSVALLSSPLLFLVGIGGFDYWFYWAIGRPTRPEDHSGHGARTWKDYFRVNTDHKVIGIQYTVTSFFFLLVGGLIAMLMRAQLAQPGAQFVDANTFNGLFSVHASLMIFLFVIPVFAGLANFVLPLMIGAPDMAFPRLNALSYWMLPLLVWANFATSLLVVIATPFIAASQFFVLLDYALGFNFFTPEKDGDVLM